MFVRGQQMNRGSVSRAPTGRWTDRQTGLKPGPLNGPIPKKTTEKWTKKRRMYVF